ncbi:MAG: hypothetical protein IKB04_00895 [Clostridia bacterium]|nr:hypothetical protein [Clostridia bacterium]
MKTKLKIAFACIFVVLLSFTLAFLYCFSGLKILNELNYVSDKMWLQLSFWISLGMLLAIGVLEVISRIRKKKFKILIWITINSSRLILFYIISLITFISLKPKVVWELGDLQNLISLEWSIFGIATTAFLVWNVVVVEFLKKKEPQNDDMHGLMIKRKIIEEKIEKYQTIGTKFNSLSLFIINLVLLVVTTATVYINEQGVEINLLNQNLAIASFYFCTNTIGCLLSDIISPLKQEKKQLEKDAQISSKDIMEKQNIEYTMITALKELKAVERMTSISEEDKRMIFAKILYKVTESPKLEKIIAAMEMEKKSIDT